MSSAFFVALRRLRVPLIALILIFSVAIVGLVLIPGEDAAGQPWRMDFFHALYVVSYMASTIGFGEIPHPFTDTQRLWITFCIFLSVFGWAYAIGKLLGVLQDRGFRHALMVERFEREVKRLREPFYLICGYGETGQLMCRALDHRRLRFVVLDHDTQRIDELDLQDYQASAPGFPGDVRLPAHLKLAGLVSPYCRGVLALTADDLTNLAVAIAARLLNPGIPALCRTSRPEVAANMASFGTRHVIDPYEKFAEFLALALHSPGSCQLAEWLTGVPGTRLATQQEPPHGVWLICGQGRFRDAIIRHVRGAGLQPILISPRQSGQHPNYRWVHGVGTQAETLREAAIEQAVGIIAGTEDDVDNLSIVVTARELNPNLFVVLRQNRTANRDLFQTIGANFTMVPSDIITHECLASLTSPLLKQFLDIVKIRDDAWADAVIARLAAILGPEVPATWEAPLDKVHAPALWPTVAGGAVALDVLRRDPGDCEARMACVPLLAIRAGQAMEMPSWDWMLQSGDRILFAGHAEVQRRQFAILGNAHVCDYVLNGRELGNSWLWRKLVAARRMN